MNNKTESIISQINMNVFFKEFTFSKNDFKNLDTNQKMEFADNVVWLDDIFFVYQIKDRNSEHTDDANWFENKVLGKGISQIKSTLKYLAEYGKIQIENEKGHKIDISKAPSDRVRKLVIYTPNGSFPENKRAKKFYESSKVGLIHLFHSEDYYWICKYLVTPAEVEEYLEFRESFYTSHAKQLNELPEQYILAHFIETLATDHIDFRYIENLGIINQELPDFNISALIENFNKKVTLIEKETDYYSIIKEISKLNRGELIEFKKRLSRTSEKCKENSFTIPYRLYFPRTECAFVFIPLTIQHAGYWKTALYQLSLAQKYDQKARKCVGLSMSIDKRNEDGYYDMHWIFTEFPWKYDLQMENLLKVNFPFRDVQTKNIYNRYKD